MVDAVVILDKVYVVGSDTNKVNVEIALSFKSLVISFVGMKDRLRIVTQVEGNCTLNRERNWRN